jgi:Short C-terminal domain
LIWYPATIYAVHIGHAEQVSGMGRLEREIQNHPVEFAKSGLGPYVAWIAMAAVYAWPFAAFHGAVRLAVGIPWLIITIAITMLIMVGNRKKAPRVPAEAQRKATPVGRDVPLSPSFSSTRSPSRNVARPLVADELRKLAELRDSGLLTETEFVNQKKRLLG